MPKPNIVTIMTIMLFCFLCVVDAFSDITLVQTMTMPSAGGNTEITKHITTLIKGNKARIDIAEDNLSAIINLNDKTIFILTHNTKTAMLLPSEFFNTILPNIPKTGKISFHKTGERKKISGYDCECYKMTSTVSNAPQIEWWLTQDIDATETEIFRKYFVTMFGLTEEETRELKGILVKSITTFNVEGKPINAITEVKSISREKIPQNSFEIPKDYQIMDIGNYSSSNQPASNLQSNNSSNNQ